MNALTIYRDRVLRRLVAGVSDERGDVPGWVLITIMTAGLVTALWKFAGTELVNLFTNAVRGVSGS